MKQHQANYTLIVIIFTLVVFGLVILSSASVVLSQSIFNQSYYFLKHQLVYGLLLGLIGFFVCQRIHYKHWKKFAFPLVLLSLVFLSLVFVPGVGYGYGEAKRWIGLGPFSIQPFEFVKITLIIYLAALLSKKGEKKQVIKDSLIPCLVTIGIISLLVFCQPNFSALALTILIAGLIYFLAGARIIYLLGIGGLGIAGLLVLARGFSYQIDRLIVYLHPEVDPQGIGYQINQALLTIGSGGLWGRGLGHYGIQKWGYLPEPIGDSIFAIVAEELGLIGAGILVILFISLAWHGFKIAKNAPDRFGYLLAGGITGWLFFQAFINMAAISGLIPLTGMPLPFVSYGGSAMVVSLISVGILVNISKYTKR